MAWRIALESDLEVGPQPGATVAEAGGIAANYQLRQEAYRGTNLHAKLACSGCGTEAAPGTKFCAECGTK